MSDTVELVNENGVLKRIDLETGEKKPVEFGGLVAESVATADVFTDATTIYVDPDGNDDNDGATPNTPKRTVESALTDAPLQGDGTRRLVLDLAAGTYSATSATGVLPMRHTPHSAVRVRGATDENGDPAAVLDGGDVNTAAFVNQSSVVFEDCKLVNGAGSTLNTAYGAAILLRNSHVVAGTDTNRAVYTQNCSYLDVDSDSVIDGRQMANADWVSASTGCCTTRLGGRLLGAGAKGAHFHKEGGWLFTKESLTADGDGASEYLLQAENNVDVKVKGGEYRNAVGIAKVKNESHLSVRESPTTSGLATDYSAGLSSSIRHVPSDTGAERWPVNDGRQQALREGGAARGLVAYNRTSGMAEYYSHDRDEYLHLGETEFGRINAILRIQRPKLDDIEYARGRSDSSISTTLENVPRRLRISHDGGGDGHGGVRGQVLTTPDSLGGFRVVFADVTFTANGTRNDVSLGVSTASPDRQGIANGDGVLFNYRAGQANEARLMTVDGGSTEKLGEVSLDFSISHDIVIAYDGSTARVYVDPSGTAEESPNMTGEFGVTGTPYAPLVQLEDYDTNAASETLEVGGISVEPMWQ